MPSFSTPSVASLQQQYVDKRRRFLNKGDDAKTSKVQAKIEELQRKHNLVGVNWLDTYRRITRGLQASELTINIDAGSWFSAKNTYGTYAQMYEKAVGKDGSMVLKDSGKGNEALERAQADDIVTLPEEWGRAHPLSQRKRLFKAMSASGSSTVKAGGAQSANVKGSALRHVGTTADGKKAYVSTNKHFDPKVKQVFAALNYGGRPRGASTYYGFSHLVLKPGLKQRALYYPADTFFLALGCKNPGVRSQATYETLGALMEHAFDGLVDDIWDACYLRRSLADTENGDLLIEAHLFQEVKIDQDIEQLVLSRQRSPSDTPFDAAAWNTVVGNAREWCQRNHVRLVFAGH